MRYPYARLISTSLVIISLAGCGVEKKTNSPLAADPAKPILDLGQGDLPPVVKDPEPSLPPTPTTPSTPSTPQNPRRPAPPSPPAPKKPPVHATRECAPHADGSFAADFQVKYGNGSSMWGQGGGCISRPIREVWATALNHALLMWDGVGKTSWNRLAPQGSLTHTYDVYYAVKRMGIVVAAWHMMWYYSVSKGNLNDPQQILINYHRSSGTTHIPYWEGTIVLEKVTDGVTGFVMRNQINADATKPADAGSAVSDVFKKLSTGAPDWSQLN